MISKSKFSRASDKKLHFQELRNEIEVMRKVRGAESREKRPLAPARLGTLPRLSDMRVSRTFALQMDHQNIIKMHDVYESANELYIVMDGQQTRGSATSAADSALIFRGANAQPPDCCLIVSPVYSACVVCAGGELFDRIKEQPDGNYSENDAADVLRQICEGLKYMHSHKIVSGGRRFRGEQQTATARRVARAVQRDDA